jgi:Kdo2-lipid IVA lauroyltransferase/acyltransferase
MKTISSAILYGLVRLYAYLPLSVSFFFSDLILYPIVYYLAGYRLKVVRENLKNSFPEKSHKELRQLERRFYRHFCDSFQETVRVLGMTEAEARQRMIFTNPEVIKNITDKGQGVLMVLGHYGNWEYQPFLFLSLLKSGSREGFNVYRPLENEAFDRLYLKIRSRFGAGNVSKNDTYRTIIRLRREKIAGIFGLISDQSPSWANIHYWTNFLNQETAILTGPERMAKKTGFAVVYADVQKLSRGHYQTDFLLMTDRPLETAEFEITEQYARLMEKTILRDPAFWLWTHKRWKHKREVIIEPKSDAIIE